MKRLLVLLLTLSMSFSLVACGAESNRDDDDDRKSRTEREKDDDDEDEDDKDEDNKKDKDEEKAEKDSNKESEESKESETVEETPAFIPTASQFFSFYENNYYFVIDLPETGEQKFYQYDINTKEIRELAVAPNAKNIRGNAMLSANNLVNIYTGEIIYEADPNMKYYLAPTWCGDNLVMLENRNNNLYLGSLNTAGEWVVPLTKSVEFTDLYSKQVTEGFPVNSAIIGEYIYMYMYAGGQGCLYNATNNTYIDVGKQLLSSRFNHNNIFLTGVSDANDSNLRTLNLFDVDTNTLTSLNVTHYGYYLDIEYIEPDLCTDDYFIMKDNVNTGQTVDTLKNVYIFDYSGNLLTEYHVPLGAMQSYNFYAFSKDYAFYEKLNPEDDYTYYYLMDTEGSPVIDPIRKEEWTHKSQPILDGDLLIGYTRDLNGLSICDIPTNTWKNYEYSVVSYDDTNDMLVVYAEHPTYGQGYYLLDAHNPDTLINPFE